MERAGGEHVGEDGDDYGAFIQRFQLYPPPPPRCSSDPPLPLQGLTFAIKYMYFQGDGERGSRTGTIGGGLRQTFRGGVRGRDGDDSDIM